MHGHCGQYYDRQVLIMVKFVLCSGVIENKGFTGSQWAV